MAAVSGFANFALHHPRSPTPREVWSVDVGSGSDSERQLLTPPVVANGRVFVKDALNTVSAYEAATGKLLWRVTLKSKGGRDDNEFGGGLAWYGGRLFVTTGFADVMALNPDDGKEIWRRAVSAPVRGAPTVFQDRVFAITIDNKLHALAAVDAGPVGIQRAQREAGFLAGPSPAASQDVVAPSAGRRRAQGSTAAADLNEPGHPARGGVQSLSALPISAAAR